ncbi:MAG: carboxypeptidase-like regulatory domain-containing protein, partial [Bacteroidales bacterium]
MKKHIFLFLILLMGGISFIYAQQTAIQGTVVDKNLNEPIIGASIVVKGTSHGTITDVDGNFSLTDVPVNSMIVASYVGYRAKEIKIVAGEKKYLISLEEDTKTLDEVVVVGFGTQRKSNLTDAVATVDTKVLESRPVTNLGQSLQGTVPGLNLSVGGYGGQLGQTLDVNIRGTGTISTGSKASTLILIDGIEGN